MAFFPIPCPGYRAKEASRIAKDKAWKAQRSDPDQPVKDEAERLARAKIADLKKEIDDELDKFLRDNQCRRPCARSEERPPIQELDPLFIRIFKINGRPKEGFECQILLVGNAIIHCTLEGHIHPQHHGVPEPHGGKKRKKTKRA